MSINIKQNRSRNTAIPKSKKSFLEQDIQLFNTFNSKKKEAFYNDLEILLRAGVDLRKAFEILLEEQQGQKDEIFYEEIYNHILSGKSLADALKSTGKFSDYEYYSIIIGEEANLLIEILVELKKYYKKKTDIRKQIVSVLSYPAFVFVVTIVIVSFLLTSLVPMFAKLYKQFDSELPELTQFIVYVSENIGYFAAVFFGGLAGLILLYYNIHKQEWFRKMSAQIVLKIPLVGDYIKKIHITRFTSSLQLLLVAKTPLVKSLKLTKSMNSFYPLDGILEDVITKITKGSSLHEGLKQHSFFSNRFISLVKVGEETNELDTMLTKLSEQFYDDLEHQSKIFGKLMEPIMLLVIGGFVGVIVMAIYLPMFNLGNVL